MFEDIFTQLDGSYNEIKGKIESGRLVDAYELCNKKEDSESWLLKAILLVLLKRYKKALELLEIADKERVELIPLDVYYEILGLCYYEEKNYLDAAKNFMSAINLNKDNFYAKYNLTNIYLLKKDYKKAYQYLLELKELRPQDQSIRKNLELLESFLETKNLTK